MNASSDSNQTGHTQEVNLVQFWVTKGNAIGNAFAVPVIARLLLALTMTVQGEGTSAFPMWANRGLAAPYRHDVLDDVFTEASFIANCYRDLVSEFDDYTEPHWHGDLVGPDPGAGEGKTGPRGRQR